MATQPAEVIDILDEGVRQHLSAMLGVDTELAMTWVLQALEADPSLCDRVRAEVARNIAFGPGGTAESVYATIWPAYRAS